MAVGRAIRPARGEAAEGERLQVGDIVTHEVFGRQFARPQHLKAVVAVGDHVDVGQDPVEDGHVVGRKSADATVAPFPIDPSDFLHRLTMELGARMVWSHLGQMSR